MDNKTAIKYISQCIDDIEPLKTEKDEGSNKYIHWREKTESIVRNIFGESSTEYKELHSVFHPEYFPSIRPSYERVDYHKKYVNSLEYLYNKLLGYKTALEMKLSSEIECDNFDSLKEVSRICSRFSNVIRSIRKRHSNRKPLTVKDEYDVQYLLRILLSVSFNDIRPEETTPSYAGTSSRIDFLLKNERIAIETKMTRENLADKELSKQLIQDIAQYQTHPDVDSLLCFIYDPEQFIENPMSIINDLESRSNEDLTIKVIVSPIL